MPWETKGKVMLREEFVKLALKKSSNFSELCRRFKISRTVGYEWLNRYKKHGLDGLEDKPRKPKSCPHQTKQTTVEKILELKGEYPFWGAKKIAAIAERHGVIEVPSITTINRILKDHDLVETRIKTGKLAERFEHSHPNILWQMDFKGHFAYFEGRCHTLTVIDDHSRYSLVLEPCRNEKHFTVKNHLISCFERFGIPKRINVDNGSPWGALHECARYTSLSVWLIKLGITVSYSVPGRPQTNGKDERFHRTLKQEIITPNYFYSLDEIKESMSAWQEQYNYVRPHEGIGMAVPADRYQISPRPYPGVIEAYEYANELIIRKVTVRGRISYQGRQIYVGTPFNKEDIGIMHHPTEDIIFIYFRHQYLGSVDLKTMPKGEAINLYSKEPKSV